MLVKNYYTATYPTINQFKGVCTVQNELSTNRFIVVLDDLNNYVGIVTPCDILERPHKIIADCLIDKPRIDINEEIISLIKRIDIDRFIVLPVFDNQIFCGIIRKIDIIKALFDKIEEVCKHSDISKNIMNLMLENLSHEVRTPLNSIVGFIEVLSSLDEEELKEHCELYSNLVLVNSEKFLLTMDSIIELAKIHSGDSIKLYSEDFSIETIFPNLVDHFKKGGLHKGKKITISHDNSMLELNINSDKKKITHILYHIIDNIILFEENINIFLGCNYIQEKQEVEFFASNHYREKNVYKLLPFFNALDDIHFNHKDFGPPFGVGITLVKEYAKMIGGNVRYKSEECCDTIFLTVPLQ